MPKTPSDQPNKWRTTELHGATGVNQETGEVIDLGIVRGLTPVRPRKSRKEIKFIMIDMDAMPRLQMSKGEWTLFWLVVQRIDRERGEARITTSELAQEMGWKAPNTSRALSRLAKRGIIIKVVVGAWRINPRLMSRKAVDTWELEMRDAPEIDWEGGDE